MNVTQWQELGYKTVLRNGNIYLYRPASGIVIRTCVNNGAWMKFDNVNEPPWIKGESTISDEFMETLHVIADYCYCGSGGVRLCDYCSGLRKAEDEDRERYEHHMMDTESEWRRP